MAREFCDLFEGYVNELVDARVRHVLRETFTGNAAEKASAKPKLKTSMPGLPIASVAVKKSSETIKGRVTDPSKDMRLKINRGKKKLKK